MPIAQLLNVHRHDRNNRALIILSGEIDLHTVPVLGESLQRCLRDGIRAIDVDLAAVPFCDCSGLNAFLQARESAFAAGAVLRLHFPCPVLLRVLTITGSGPLLLALPADALPHDSAPAHSAPAHSAPAHSAPAHSAPAHSAPARPAAVYGAAGLPSGFELSFAGGVS